MAYCQGCAELEDSRRRRDELEAELTQLARDHAALKAERDEVRRALAWMCGKEWAFGYEMVEQLDCGRDTGSIGGQYHFDANAPAGVEAALLKAYREGAKP